MLILTQDSWVPPVSPCDGECQTPQTLMPFEYNRWKHYVTFNRIIWAISDIMDLLGGCHIRLIKIPTFCLSVPSIASRWFFEFRFVLPLATYHELWLHRVQLQLGGWHEDKFLFGWELLFPLDFLFWFTRAAKIPWEQYQLKWAWGEGWGLTPTEGQNFQTLPCFWKNVQNLLNKISVDGADILTPFTLITRIDPPPEEFNSPTFLRLQTFPDDRLNQNKVPDYIKII